MKVFFETLGCPKNINDSELAAGILLKEGFEITDDLFESDVVIINTCGFINDAKIESVNRIFELSQAKPEEVVLVVSGCLSQRYMEELFKEMPEVDIFIGVNNYGELPKIIKEHKAGSREKHIKDYDKKFIEHCRRKLPKNPYSGTIKISEGCNNICAYCIIPSIRGHYRSRKMEDILSEAEYMTQSGCRELILIAQDTSGYGKDLYGEYKLAELLRKLCRIEGIEWIRIMYCYEDKITEELIEVMASEEKICKYIDIPIQHSSDNILKSMNRNSTRASIMETIGKLRAAMPDIHIRTTLITGFPGEKKEDFEDLLEFVNQVRFERLGVFAYSREEGTAAAEMKGQVRSDVKEKRKDAILRRQIEISLESNQSKIGRTLKVLVEGIDDEGAYYGRTQYDAPEIDNSVIFTFDDGGEEYTLKPGEFVEVEIVDAFDYDLVGVVLTNRKNV